jgi:hypothetical protein
MFVLCVASKRQKAKRRTIKTKNPVRMKYREHENTKKNPADTCRGAAYGVSSHAGIADLNPAGGMA